MKGVILGPNFTVDGDHMFEQILLYRQRPKGRLFQMLQQEYLCSRWNMLA